MKIIHLRALNESGNALPEYKSIDAAGCDLRAKIEGKSAIVIPKYQSAVIGTGLHLSIPTGYEAQVRGRSGLNFNNGIVCPVGTIDADYRGEIKVKLYNMSSIDFIVKNGDRIAQLVFSEVVRATMHEADELDSTERGEGGFGHTGKD